MPPHVFLVLLEKVVLKTEDFWFLCLFLINWKTMVTGIAFFIFFDLICTAHVPSLCVLFYILLCTVYSHCK